MDGSNAFVFSSHSSEKLLWSSKLIVRICKVILIVGTIFASNVSSALPPKTFAYYYGSGRILNLQSGAGSTEETLLLRVVDPLNNHLIEVACTRDPGAAAVLSATYMLINGNTLTLSDKPDYTPTGKLVGTGKLTGNPWLWNYLSFSIQYYFSSTPGSFMQIDDANYLVGNQLVGRKQLYLSSRGPLTPFELWDAELNLISSGDFKTHANEMSCPPFPNL